MSVLFRAHCDYGWLQYGLPQNPILVVKACFGNLCPAHRQHVTRIDSVKAAKAGDESVLQAGARSLLINRGLLYLMPMMHATATVLHVLQRGEEQRGLRKPGEGCITRSS